jgi:hypothetical protein
VFGAARWSIKEQGVGLGHFALAERFTFLGRQLDLFI